MTPGQISRRIVADRLAWVRQMLGEIRALPLESPEEFFADRRNLWAAESCLRRALEALLDLGRHLLAKGFGIGVTEYKEIAIRLREQGVLNPDTATLLSTLAGYCNRLVHFYHEVGAEEIFRICSERLGDIEQVADAYRRWLKEHSERLNETL